ncbi:MAG: hypothetical protein ABSC39_18085, partial [Roseiarcus sp.]
NHRRDLRQGRGFAMSAFPLTRRAALGILALSPAVAVRSALAQPNVRFRNIVVDVSPLRASMGDPTAAWVQQELPGALAQALAGYMAPGDRYGATLVARIDDLYLGPSSGGTGPWGAAQDTINGTLLVKGPHGGMAAGAPIRAITWYHPMAVDQPMRVESNHWRVVALAQAFAGWAPRELGL